VERPGGSWWRFATEVKPGAGRRKRRTAARRLRAGFAPPHSGGPGGSSAPTTRGCLQWLDVVGMKESESFPDEIEPQGSISLSPEVRVQGQKSPQVERRMASVPIARRATALKGGLSRQSAVRRSIPSPLWGASHVKEGQTDEGLPGADSKNTGDDARLHGPENSARALRPFSARPRLRGTSGWRGRAPQGGGSSRETTFFRRFRIAPTPRFWLYPPAFRSG
jgi:hypothetical protein